MAGSFRQNEVLNPHLRLPLQFGGVNGGALVNEEDSEEDITDCLRAIIAYTIGDRADLPDFGIPDLVFMQESQATISQVRSALSEWEDRAVIDVEGGPSFSDQMIWGLLVKAGITDG